MIASKQHCPKQISIWCDHLPNSLQIHGRPRPDCIRWKGWHYSSGGLHEVGILIWIFVLPARKSAREPWFLRTHRALPARRPHSYVRRPQTSQFLQLKSRAWLSVAVNESIRRSKRSVIDRIHKQTALVSHLLPFSSSRKRELLAASQSIAQTFPPLSLLQTAAWEICNVVRLWPRPASVTLIFDTARILTSIILRLSRKHGRSKWLLIYYLVYK